MTVPVCVYFFCGKWRFGLDTVAPIWYNNSMGIGENASDHYRYGVVIEAFDSPFNQYLGESKHLVVTALSDFRTTRYGNNLACHFLYVRYPTAISFGDKLQWNEDEDIWYLTTNPHLRYKLDLRDEMPRPILDRLLYDRGADVGRRLPPIPPHRFT